MFVLSKTWYVTIPITCASVGGWEGLFFGIGVNAVLICVSTYCETYLDLKNYFEKKYLKKQILQYAQNHPGALPTISWNNRLLQGLHQFCVFAMFAMIPIIILSSLHYKNAFSIALQLSLYGSFFGFIVFSVLLPHFIKKEEFDNYGIALQKEIEKQHIILNNMKVKSQYARSSTNPDLKVRAQ